MSGDVRLARVAVHPVKGTAGRVVESAEVEPWGLADDRRWMVITPDAECLTARRHPTLFAVAADTPRTRPGLPGDLRLTAPGHGEVDVIRPEGPARPVTVFGRPLTAVDAAAEASAWVRSALRRDDVTLVHVAEPRPLNPAYGRPGEATAFADGYPLTLASTASLRQLDEWVTDTALSRGEEPPAPLDVARFRPNLVLDGDLEPFEEDHWREVRVGAVVFRVAKPVDRCVMTTLDPTTGERGHEPIRTLARHRRWDGKTWFCSQLVPETTGVVRAGDAVVASR
ncbi:MAG: MOSC domain-containing protein [Dermatophilaceae bacterium]